MDSFPLKLEEFPAHLGRGATAKVLPRFDGTMEWYQRYGEDTQSDGADGWLVSWFRFDQSWDSWEMHPEGHEIVVCVDGEAEVVQEIDGAQSGLRIAKGEWFFNPPGAWHTMDVAPGGSCTGLFITAGRGTQHRPR